MAIVIKCGCGRELRAKDEAAGKKSKCPHCGSEVFIPAPTESKACFDPVAIAAADCGPPPITATGSPVSTNWPKSTEIRSIPARRT